MEIIKYKSNIEAAHCLRIVKNGGALLLRNFVDLVECTNIINESTLELMLPIDEREAKIAQQFETLNFSYLTEASPAVRKFGQRLISFVQPVLPKWRPNDVAIQRYLPTHIGIDNHRDYASDILLVAVASLEGSARFHIEADEVYSKQWSNVEVCPGDLVLLRAPGLTGHPEDRPYHRIEAPLAGQRVSIAYRQNSRLGGQ